MLSLLGAALLLAIAPAAQANHFPWGTVCHTTAAPNETYTTVAAQPWRWQCADDDWSTGKAKAFVRFDLRGTSDPVPRAFVTRLTRFERMTISAVDHSGRVLATRVFLANCCSSIFCCSVSLMMLVHCVGRPTNTPVLWS